MTYKDIIKFLKKEIRLLDDEIEAIMDDTMVSIDEEERLIRPLCNQRDDLELVVRILKKNT